MFYSYYFTAPASLNCFIPSFPHPNLSLIFYFLVLLYWNCIVYSLIQTQSLFCCSLVFVFCLFFFFALLLQSREKEKNKVQYTEQEEISRITNFNFFGLDLVEMLEERMDLDISLKKTNFNSCRVLEPMIFLMLFLNIKCVSFQLFPPKSQPFFKKQLKHPSRKPFPGPQWEQLPPSLVLTQSFYLPLCASVSSSMK